MPPTVEMSEAMEKAQQQQDEFRQQFEQQFEEEWLLDAFFGLALEISSHYNQSQFRKAKV